MQQYQQNANYFWNNHYQFIQILSLRTSKKKNVNNMNNWIIIISITGQLISRFYFKAINI